VSAALAPAREEDAVLGVRPRAVVEPATAAEAAEAMRGCARDRQRMVFVGGGTDLGVGAPPTGLDVVLRTARLDRVVEHAPSDQIVVAEAGLTLAALQRTLAVHGQRLAIDPPFAGRATLGGIVAANAFGPSRTRYGTARDLIIGVSLVRADGVAARGGGKVVKNVAGFDLPRLFVGSLGTLGLITSVTFRLHPLPEASATVLVERPSGAQARAVVVAVREARLEPASVTLLVRPGGVRLGIRFEGFGPGVRQQAERLAGLGPALGVRFDRPDESGAAAFWASHEAARTSGALRVRVAAPPSALAAVLDGALAPLAGALTDGWSAFDPWVGAGFAGGTPTDTAAAVAALGTARGALGALGGSLVLAAAPAGIRGAFDGWGPAPSSVEVMRRLKARLDPEGRLAPGRFVGGI
jgi:glycolate oxidase FAD binding subunit